mmetsp:Transcript_4705/g.6345  ORF Transcript_4705/g.6345 Transcript_4705/m.6345 type:complete len:716 (-) Transcript_4705:25-2172(-)
MVGTKRGGRTLSSRASRQQQSRRGGTNDNGNKFAIPRTHLDPLLLSRGMTGRVLGARIPELEPLSSNEVKSDFYEIEKLNAECTQYAQRLYIYRNRLNVSTHSSSDVTNSAHGSAHITSAGNGVNANLNSSSSLSRGSGSNGNGIAESGKNDKALTDPEEEKRTSHLRKKAAWNESKREVLESQYVSLRAHYVHECQRLEKIKTHGDMSLLLLQTLVRKRAEILALKRCRNELCSEILDPANDYNHDIDNVKKMWKMLNHRIMNAEKECDQFVNRIDGTFLNDSPYHTHHSNTTNNKNNSKNNKPNTRGSTSINKSDKHIRVNWDSIKVSSTTRGLPLLLSPLSRAPDRMAALCYGGLFGSSIKDMVWDEKNLPSSLSTLTNCDSNNETHNDVNANEESLLKHLLNESEELEKSLLEVRKDNVRMNAELRESRKQSDAICSRMALLRTETEAVVMRHNLVLDTPEARARADALVGEEEDDGEEEQTKVIEVKKTKKKTKKRKQDFETNEGLQQQHYTSKGAKNEKNDDDDEEEQIGNSTDTPAVENTDESNVHPNWCESSNEGEEDLSQEDEEDDDDLSQDDEEENGGDNEDLASDDGEDDESDEGDEGIDTDVDQQVISSNIVDAVRDSNEDEGEEEEESLEGGDDSVQIKEAEMGTNKVAKARIRISRNLKTSQDVSDVAQDGGLELSRGKAKREGETFLSSEDHANKRARRR